LVLRGSLHKGAFLFVFRRAPIGAVVYTSQGPHGSCCLYLAGPPSLGSLLFANKKAAEYSQLFYLENDKISERQPAFFIALARVGVLFSIIFFQLIKCIPQKLCSNRIGIMLNIRHCAYPGNYIQNFFPG